MDLKPCPFCGQRLVHKSDHHGKWWAHWEEPGPCIESTVQIFDEDDARQWNTRATPPPESSAPSVDFDTNGDIGTPDSTGNAMPPPPWGPLHQGIEDRVSGDDLRQLIREAYIAGCTDVHENYEECADPDFGEAGDDYAASIALPHTVRAEPVEDEGAKTQRLLDYRALTKIADHLREHPAEPYSGRQCQEHVLHARDALYALPQDPDPLIGELVGALEAIRDYRIGRNPCAPDDDLETQMLIHVARLRTLAIVALDKARLYQGEG